MRRPGRTNRPRNGAGEGDHGKSYGIAAVQQIERYGIDLYT